MMSRRALKLFKKAARELPAYHQFLLNRHFNPKEVKSPADFDKIPFTSKKTYLVPSKQRDLIWEKNQKEALWFCSTSGSTGEPYYFPRIDELAARGSLFVEDFLKYSSYGSGRTLVLLGFGMGVWIGGVITLRSFEIAAQRAKLPVAFLPVGYNKKEIFKALKKLAPNFEQTILVGYPPFVKEVIDEAPLEGIDLTASKLRLMFAAEAFTEQFRDYVCKKAGVQSPLLDTLNIYGSADMGAMAYETPLSILVRRLALKNPFLYKDMFGQIEKTPTLAQYNPKLIEFEGVEGELLLTSDGALPLIRYAIGDHGGVLTFNEMKKLFERYNIDLSSELRRAGIEATIAELPFVFVYERADLSATLHGIIIYPEFVKASLLKTELAKDFSGRFVMSTKHDIDHNQFLQINLELRRNAKQSKDLEKTAYKIIKATLIEKSSEFAEVAKSRSGSQLIQIIIWPNGHERYFAPGTKQKWVEKEA